MIYDDLCIYSQNCEFYERVGLDVDIIEMNSDGLSEILEYDIYDYPLVLVVDSRLDTVKHYIDYDRQFLQYMNNPREPHV